MKTFFEARNLNVKQPLLVGYRAASDLIGKAAFLLITVAAARRLSQGAFGVFSLASTIGWMAAIAGATIAATGRVAARCMRCKNGYTARPDAFARKPPTRRSPP